MSIPSRPAPPPRRQSGLHRRWRSTARNNRVVPVGSLSDTSTLTPQLNERIREASPEKVSVWLQRPAGSAAQAAPCAPGAQRNTQVAQVELFLSLRIVRIPSGVTAKTRAGGCDTRPPVRTTSGMSQEIKEAAA